MDRVLIVNADDLGLAPGVTRGILALARRGAVTSTSLLVNMPGSLAALDAARAEGLDVGVHLNICGGAPLSSPHAIRSLLGAGGCFASAGEIARRRFAGTLRLAEVECEWSAQIERVLAAGVRPSHLDSHCHLHAYPGLYRLAVRLARRYDIPGLRLAYRGFIVQAPRVARLRAAVRSPQGGVRVPYHPDFFSVLTVLGPIATPRPLQALLRALPGGVTELVCHPGHVDDELRRVDPLTDARERELLLLSRPSFAETLEGAGIRRASWREAAAWSAAGTRGIIEQ